MRVKVYLGRGVAPVLDRSRSAKLVHPRCCEPLGRLDEWPLVTPFLANSGSELAELFQRVECRANIRRAQVQPGGTALLLNGRVDSVAAIRKTLSGPVAQEMLETAYAKPYGQRARLTQYEPQERK